MRCEHWGVCVMCKIPTKSILVCHVQLFTLFFFIFAIIKISSICEWEYGQASPFRAASFFTCVTQSPDRGIQYRSIERTSGRTGRYTLVLIDREPFRVRDLSQYTAARSVASTRTIKTELKSRDGNF